FPAVFLQRLLSAGDDARMAEPDFAVQPAHVAGRLFALCVARRWRRSAGGDGGRGVLRLCGDLLLGGGARAFPQRVAANSRQRRCYNLGSTVVLMQILDLRHLRSRDLEPLLQEEKTLWRHELEWDYSASADLIRRYIDTASLPGYAAMENGR